MRIRTAALAAPLLLAGALGTALPTAPTYAAAAICQGLPATIEGSTGTITGTEGNDVIVSTGTETTVNALGGDDVVCVVGGSVSSGLGDDAVLSTAAAGTFTQAYLTNGSDTFVGGAGRSDVIVDEVTSITVDLRAGGGVVELDPAETVGTGTLAFGSLPSSLLALGEREARVDLRSQTASVDGRLTVSTVGLHHATATGCTVRMYGDGQDNNLNAFGHSVVVEGGAGSDDLARVGNGFDLDLPRCHGYKSVFRGQGGADELSGRLGDDVLLGGRGRDVANGAGGVDTCRAEVEKKCER